MIYVTVGTQLPFDRLLNSVDLWVEKNSSQDVLAQIGPSAFSSNFIECVDFLSPDVAQEKMFAADVIVSHAGMGTILNAMQLGKPLIVMPRSYDLGEHRNDHQTATAQKFFNVSNIFVVRDSVEMFDTLNQITSTKANRFEKVNPFASDKFIEKLKLMVNC